MLKIAAVVCIAFALLCGVGRAATQTELKRIALVIGNADYQNAPRLSNPRNDARLVARSLQEAGFTIVNGGVQLDLDIDGMRDAMRAFGRMLSANTVAVFYYSGHGIEYHGENYLVPINADPTSAADVELDLVNVGLLLRQIEATHNGMTIVILDACRTNPFTKGLKDVTGGLAQMQAPRGTLVAFATEPGHSALDGAKDGNSPYATALADEIRKPGLDVFNTFNEIARRVDEGTRHQQTPWFSSSPIAGQFYFIPPTASPPVAAPAPPPTTTAAIPPVPPTPTVDSGTIAQLLQAELRRVGCYGDAVNGVWDRKSSDALADFNKHAQVSLDVRAPSLDAVKAVSGRAGRVCPLVCPRGEVVVGDHCTAAQPVRAGPAKKSHETASAPASPPGKRCDTWAGQTYCE